MKHRSYILILAGATLALIALFLFVSGCGDDETSSGAYKCDVNEPSIIPPANGMPQHIYFYKDT